MLFGFLIKLWLVIPLITLSLPLAAIAEVSRSSIMVITSTQFPIQGSNDLGSYTIKVFNLDDVRAVEERLSSGLPARLSEAKKIMDSRIKALGQESFNRQLLAAYEPLLQAMQLRIDRFPAIVFDRRAVVYGVPDIDTATQIYERWLNQGDIHSD